MQVLHGLVGMSILKPYAPYKARGFTASMYFCEYIAYHLALFL